MYLETYYVAYFVLCALIVFAVGRSFRRSGALFLADSFGGNTALVQAVTHLLDVGFCLISFGYVGLTFRTYMVIRNLDEVGLSLCSRLGGFLLLLGFMHCFNVLILAVSRRRAVRVARAGELS
jgi:hypothetical protein